jgi:glycosyltransferase involved in cell wall biosynthesis
VAERELPSFDLVLATVDRTDELSRFLASLERQTHRGFRVVLVDQNPDGRIEAVLREHAGLDLVHLRADRGLSRARNAALPSLAADVVAFPDDDCVYPPDVLERVARRLAADPALDGITGRATGADGSSSPSWKPDGALLTRDNLWNRAISFTIFLRASLLARVGRFDEQLGLGAGTAWSSGEEIDLLIRALALGARIEYDPALTVEHEEKTQARAARRALAARDGATVGYLLRKHGYPATSVLRMLVRPAGGALEAVVRRDLARAAVHLSTLQGRLLGYRRAALT